MKVCAKREDEPYYRVASDDLQTCEGMAYDEKIARLFAAAPELLKVLEDANKALVYAGIEPSEASLEAIARAKGE